MEEVLVSAQGQGGFDISLANRYAIARLALMI